MRALRVPIRVVLYQDERVWVAHCLEFGLLGDGPSREEALDKLSQAVRIQVEATLDFGNPANLFSPAEGEVFRMFAAGADVPELRLEVAPLGEIDIETVQVREFSEAETVAV